jgi:hypothetical protein
MRTVPLTTFQRLDPSAMQERAAAFQATMVRRRQMI